MIAKVLLNRASAATDAFYDYLIPENMQISIGMRVAVPFGNGNKTEEGYVANISEKSEYKRLKAIIAPIDGFCYFTPKDIELAEFMHHRYFCKYSEAIKCMLPPNVNTKFKKMYRAAEFISDEATEEISHSVLLERIMEALKTSGSATFEQLSEAIRGKNLKTSLARLTEIGAVTEKISSKESIKDAEATVVRPALEKEDLYAYADKILKRAPKQAAVLEAVCDYGEIAMSELLELCDTTHSTVNALVDKGYLALGKEIVRSDIIGSGEYADFPRVKLTDEQSKVANEIGEDIEKNTASSFLLHGITGSGKTEIYLSLVEKCISQGKNAIFLVPEISLTPQMIRQVVGRFGENVAVLHSSLTLRERYDQWKKIKCGEVNVVVGARSAVFAPFEGIGLIIIDEEHENTYKSELSPKYSTVEIARFRAKQANATLLLASATPSVESYYLAKSGKFRLLELKKRINDAVLPQVEVVDMRKELKDGNTGILSAPLKDAIAFNLENGFKTILFLNRRGYSGFIQCRSCGYVLECPNCNISMTYHRHSSSLVCHYCDYKTKVMNTCPKCGSNHIKFSGDGTQKAEDEISLNFPNASILRMDADTTVGRNAHKEILDRFSKDGADILVGTQMITKGLDFEKVTLVGVLAADMSLNINDFRSDEKTFDLITQVCGRAGRGKYGGRAIIQTYDPDNETIKFSKEQDYEKFYNREIEVRRNLTYPPFCEMLNFAFSSENEVDAMRGAIDFQNILKAKLTELDCLNYVVAYNVMPSPIQKINGRYRYRFIMKLAYTKKLFDAVHNAAEEYRNRNGGARLVIELNPNNMY